MKTISLKLPDRLNEELTDLADQKGVSKSALLREVVEGYLAGQETPGKGTFLERARHLIGCIEGPEDLSTNQEYLHGYGQ
jgi:metal-responsive CopG/Arc/MetJ family transcriptional regulator